jgi:hypothetical protein
MSGFLDDITDSLIAVFNFTIFSLITIGLLATAVITSVVANNQNNYADYSLKTYDYRDCNVRIITEIVSPLAQNVSDIVSKKVCYNYKHLKTELYIGDQPKVDQGLVVATVLCWIFGLVFGWLLIRRMVK